MHLPSSEALKFTAKHKGFLQGMEISADTPGSILRDFETVLDFARNNELKLTSEHQLPLGALADINARLIHPIQLGLKRSQQKSYPHIHGLYLLMRASSLTTVDVTGRKPVLKVDEDVCRQWESLNLTERYGSLLEAWLLRGKSEIVGERGRPFGMLPDNFERIAWFYTRIPPDNDGLRVAGDRNVEDGLRDYPEWHNLGLLDLFGLISVQRGASEAGKGWQIERIHRTPLGDALMALLHSEFFSNFDNLFRLEDEGIEPFGVLQPVLQTCFPGWQNNLAMPEWEFRQGTYSFSVALGRIWRRVAIDARCSLDELAGVILDSVEFDSDHLYQFSYQSRYGSLQEVNHPYIDEGRFTSEVRIGELPLSEGQAMTFLFDFGDNWEFEVTLERIDPARVTKRTAILESHGKAPEQYPNWEE